MTCGLAPELHAAVIPPDTMTRTCRYCGQSILWGFTHKGRRAPFNPGTLANHFITCPKVPTDHRPGGPRTAVSP